MKKLLETDRLIIRELEESDEKAFIDMVSDGSIASIFQGWENCSEWMAEWIREARGLYLINNPKSEYLAYAIVKKDTNEVIGSVGCSAYEDWNEVGITYFIGSKYRNCGFASEAANAYAIYFIKTYDFNYLIATVEENNF